MHRSVLLALAAPLPHNRQPGLLPPRGMWRGATLQTAVFGNISNFQRDFGVPLHVFRTFKTEAEVAFTEPELEFIGGGGIVFYSTQPKSYKEWSSGAKDSSIAAYAAEIKKVAPAQVFIAPGFEPDGHADTSGGEANKDLYGTPTEYRTMYRRYRTVFEQHGVTNAVFVMDYSNGAHNNQTLLEALYPGDGYVDWVFHNFFQSHPESKKKNNCTDGILANYAALSAFKNYSNLPWGLGAWGTRNQSFDNPPSPNPDSEREECLAEMRKLFDDSGPRGSRLPKYRAAIYFNSLNCVISPRHSVPYGYPELAPAMTTMFESKPFTENDR